MNILERLFKAVEDADKLDKVIDNSKLPETTCNIPMPETKALKVEPITAQNIQVEELVLDREKILLKELKELQKVYKENFKKNYYNIEMLSSCVHFQNDLIPYTRIDEVIEKLKTIKRIKEIKSELGID